MAEVLSDKARKIIADVEERNRQHASNLNVFLNRIVSNGVETTGMHEGFIRAVRDGMRESARRLSVALKEMK